MIQKKNAQIIYGRNPILEAIHENKEFEKIFIKDSLSGEFEKEIRALCKEHSITLKRVPAIKLDKLTNTKNHQGLVAIVSIVKYLNLDDIIPHLYEKGVSPLLLVLDNVQDVRNIGAIARSIEVLGGDAMILSGKNQGMITKDSIKTSSGALFRLSVSREKNTIDLIHKLKSHGIKVYGASNHAEKFLHDSKLQRPLAIIMGGENEGLHSSVESECDGLIQVRQSGGTESLNVSVAAGIILYEIGRSNEAN